MLRLLKVENVPIAHMVLWDLLKEREPEQNISHVNMPTWGQHYHFVKNHPHKAWYIVEAENKFVGAIYITNMNEIGIAIYKKYQRAGYGVRAIEALKELHPADKYLANIAPGNIPSQDFFKKLGFKLIQYTYQLGLASFIFINVAFAQIGHDLYHSTYMNWTNNAGQGCCNNRDCGIVQDEDVQTINGMLHVFIRGVGGAVGQSSWCPVRIQHYLKSGNAPDWSHHHACVSDHYKGATPCAQFICFQPKPLG